jgi:GTPase
MIDLHEIENKPEKAILIGRYHQKQKKEKTEEYLDELEFLASTINIITECRFMQNLEMPEKKTFLGKGKLEEVKTYIKGFDIETIIFDDDLSPSQVRNLERELEIKIYDRTLLILDIFLFRAQSAQAQTQVELARAQYLLPRLTNMWTHLERQRGGTGTRGGSGEKEIETDKRDIRDKITKLREKLKKIELQSETQRKSRQDQIRLSLVGYTNVGKSTLMNLLTNADLFAENKLFATVDATVRKISFQGIPCLLSDTVGFIRKLPTGLIECFKSTLSEVKECDLILHVIDVSHELFEEQLEVVHQILGDVGAADKPRVLVFNKIDALVWETNEITKEEYFQSLNERYKNINTSCIFISAQKDLNIDVFKQHLYDKTKSLYLERYPNYINAGFLKYEYTEEDSVDPEA